MNTLRIIDIIQTPHAILHKFGVLVFERVKPLIEAGKQVSLSFDGLQGMTSGFAHASVGSLYQTFGVEVSKVLHLTDLNNENWQSKIQEAITLATDKAQDEAHQEAWRFALSQ